ncbi:biotin transporter BioY, partial [Rhizobium ruizarguesonis]
VNHQQSGLVQTVSFFLSAMAGVIVVLYAFGITYLATVAVLGFTKAFVGSMSFIPGDVIKAFVAALLGLCVRRATAAGDSRP